MLSHAHSAGLVFLLAIGLTIVASDSRVVAQATDNNPAKTEPEAAPPTEKQIDASLKELESRTDIEEPLITSAKDIYLAAKQLIQAANKSQAKADEFNKKSATATVDLEQLRTQIDQPTKPSTPDPDAGSATELQSQLAEKTVALQRARDELTRLSSEPSRRQARVLEIPKLIEKAQQDAEAALSQLEQIDTDESPLVAAARKAQLQATLSAARNELAALNGERKFYEATTESLPLQREVQEQEIQRLQTEIELWQTAISERRDDQIYKLSRAAAALVAQSPPELKPSAQRNVELIEQFRSVSRQLAETSDTLNDARATLTQIESDFEIASERVDAVGLNDTLGLMLRRSKAALIATRQKFQPKISSSENIKQFQVALFEYQDLSSYASETDSSIERLFVESGISEVAGAELENDARQILAQRRDILAPLTQAQSELFQRKLEEDTIKRQVVAEIDQFIKYINEHILWIRSGPIFGANELRPLVSATRWIFDSDNWSSLREAVSEILRRKLGLLLFLASSFLLLLIMRFRMRNFIRSAGEIAQAGACRSFAPTAETLINTFLIATVWPFLFLSAGWLLLDSSEDSFVQALARSLVWVTLAVFPFELMRQTCRPSGLGQCHFDWPKPICQFVFANLRWLNPLIAGLLFVVCLLQNQPEEAFRNSLGRLAMAFLLIVFAIYVFKVLHPSSPLYEDTSKHFLEGVWYRFRRFRFNFVLGIIAALLLFTLGGYYYSTYQIGSRLLQTNALIIGYVLAYALVMRWLLVRRRRLQLEHLLIRREELKHQPPVAQTFGDQVKVELQSEAGLNSEDVSRQSKQLILIGMTFIALSVAYQIWADVIPAMGILDQIEIGSVSVAGVNERVTLQHLALSLLTIAGTIFTVKNLPGILELLLLKRLPMDAGARYAVVTIVRYVVTIVGIIIACGLIKIQWSQFGWLVAAISVGLGFGLQEIVANFVSGLILLLERPVRVGDIVTIEGTTGVISRIQMRATTVTNWDQQELIVPNKNLITNSIVNWTLSNMMTRITIPVGVAYGADATEVQRCILQTVKSNPEVLSDPPCTVTFENFGDSALNFVVRCCISGPDRRLATIHQLHVAIHQALAAQGIEIPFPQRDIHIIGERTVDAKTGASPKQ